MRKKVLAGLATGVLMFCTISTADATTISNDFSLPINDWVTYGNAHLNQGSEYLELTGYNFYTRGSAFYNTPINSTNFTASFDFRTGPNVNEYRSGDGFTFAFVEQPGLGALGSSLGFTGLDGYAVEFDTFGDGLRDHVAITTDPYSPGIGNTHLVYNDTIPELETYQWFHVDIAFNNGNMQVALDGIEYIDYSISNFNPYDAYFGFTAGSGAARNYHSIDNFVLTSNPVPEPATMLLFGTGLAGLAGTRLRRKKK